MVVHDPVIRLRNVGFGYEPARPVLQGIHFELMPGDRIGLTGPNGCGKTTLLHLMVGLIHPTCGEVEAFGELRRSEKDFREVRRRVGLLFQDSDDQLFCPTVREDVAFGPLNLGKPPNEALSIARSTLAQVGLAGYEDRITYKLSGGEKRLVALATVLAMEPETLLLDEPVAGLDETAEAQITEILAELPLDMVVASHNRAFLDRVRNKAFHFRDGHLTPGSPPVTPTTKRPITRRT